MIDWIEQVLPGLRPGWKLLTAGDRMAALAGSAGAPPAGRPELRMQPRVHAGGMVVDRLTINK